MTLRTKEKVNTLDGTCILIIKVFVLIPVLCLFLFNHPECYKMVLRAIHLCPGFSSIPKPSALLSCFFNCFFFVVFEISSHHQPTVFIVFVEKLDKKAGNSIALTALALASHEMGLFHPKEKVGHRG